MYFYDLHKFLGVIKILFTLDQIEEEILDLCSFARNEIGIIGLVSRATEREIKAIFIITKLPAGFEEFDKTTKQLDRQDI